VLLVVESQEKEIDSDVCDVCKRGFGSPSFLILHTDVAMYGIVYIIGIAVRL
jgi:hypothetical protein